MNFTSIKGGRRSCRDRSERIVSAIDFGADVVPGREDEVVPGISAEVEVDDDVESV